MRITEFSEIDIIVRTHLIRQSQIDQSLVKNLASRYGSSFSKNETDEIFDSVLPSDNIIFFITEKSPSSNDVSLTNEDETITQYSSYDVKVSIYGDDSANLAMKLVARFRTSKVRTSMFESGLHIHSIEESGSIHEFKNDVAWLRTDFTIHVECEHRVEQVEDDLDVSSLNIISDKELK